MAKRILVIDDDEDILSIMDILFGDEGYEPILYQTGTTIENIKHLNPDLILLDVRITGFEKTGSQICAEIRKDTELDRIPVILVSAEPDVRKLSYDCGANSYINKPFDVANLLAKVKEFLY